MNALSAALASVLLVTAVPATGVEIRYVSHGPASIDPTRGEVATIRFRLSEPASVLLHVYDGRDLRIRSVESGGDLAAGDHALVWDGTDFAGRPVPPEAYAYTIEAREAAGEISLWDVTDATGGEPARLTATWAPEAGRIRYRLTEPARVRVRVGIRNGGPLLRTVVDWVARGPGEQAEPWDGHDAARVLDLTHHPSLALAAEAFSLSDNTILVGPALLAVRLIPDVPDDAHRRVRRDPPKRMYDYARQALTHRRDFAVHLRLPEDVERNGEGLPVLHGPTPMRVEVEDEELQRVLDQRCEVLFFIDGQLVFENEVGFLPTTWTWQPRGMSAGVHHVTANVRGFEGHFGVSTVRFVYQPGGGAARAAPGVDPRAPRRLEGEG